MNLRKTEIKPGKRRLTVKSQISVGEILTVFAIVISAIGLGYGWYKDRVAQSREAADQVRQNTGTVTAKLERWAILSSRYYSDIQPLLIDSSLKVAETRRLDPANSILMRGLYEAQVRSSQRAIDEQVEIAYAGLYGYDPKIYDLFTAAVCQLKEREQKFAVDAVVETQDTLRANLGKPSQEINEALRSKCAELHESLQSEMEKIIKPFREQMIKLIQSSDEDIVNRRVVIPPPHEIFPQNSDSKCGMYANAKQQ